MADSVTSWKRPSRFPLPSGRRLSQALLLLLITGLCIANWLLIKQNRTLKAAITHGARQPEFLKQGQQVPPLAAKNLSGQRQVLNYADHAKTVLLVFLTQCEACERSLPYWREIAAACARNQYQIFGISLDNAAKTKAFLTSQGLSLETLVDVDAATSEAYKLTLTPQTIVIDNNGKVERIWPGTFGKETKLEVEKYFGVSAVDDVK